VRKAQEDPNDLEAQLGAADLEVAAGRAEHAFERLIGVVRAHADPARTTARKHLVELFELFDPADPVVIAARRKLASALY
jgi:putative thioredoxin